MRKLSFVFILFMLAFISNSYAQLPNNPANPQGTLISNADVLAKWEKQGDSLYYEITITTPTTFNDQSYPFGGAVYNESYIQFYGYEHDYNVKYPGSLSIIFDASSFPYGTRTYCGVMDITGWSDDWTTIQADYQFFDSSNNAHEASEFITPEAWE